MVVETAALMEPIMYDIFHCTGYTQLAIPRIEYKTQILFFSSIGKEGGNKRRKERGVYFGYTLTLPLS